MVTIVINRPTLPARSTYTSSSDYVRGTGARDVLGYGLSAAELSFLQPLLNQNQGNENAVYDAFFTGQLSLGPNLANFNGNDTIHGRGGNDYVVDLAGSNSVVTEEGNDRVLLGFGNDRVFDQGGNNNIADFGGNNTITTRDGDDTITTGAGNDNINAFDGTNFVDAGDGNNIMRGGDGLDILIGGMGNDFAEVQAGSLVTEEGIGFPPLVQAVDENGTPVFDDEGNPVWAEHTTFIDLSPLFALLGGIGFIGHNIMLDYGGDDTFRASSTSRNDQPGFPDRVFNGDDLVVSDLSLWEAASPIVFGQDFLVNFLFSGDELVADVTTGTSNFSVGTDSMTLGGGNNMVLDFAGDTTVVTLEGSDQVYTSWFSEILSPLIPGLEVGNDDINVGAGNDLVSVGLGDDIVRGGAGVDTIDLTAIAGTGDGYEDQLVYFPVDLPIGAGLEGADNVLGFEAGTDKIDLRPLGDAEILSGVSWSEAGADVIISLTLVGPTGALVQSEVAYLVGVGAGQLTGGDFILDDPLSA